MLQHHPTSTHTYTSHWSHFHFCIFRPALLLGMHLFVKGHWMDSRLDIVFVLNTSHSNYVNKRLIFFFFCTETSYAEIDLLSSSTFSKYKYKGSNVIQQLRVSRQITMTCPFSDKMSALFELHFHHSISLYNHVKS